jgi:amino acid adenylation domain-containing protein
MNDSSRRAEILRSLLAAGDSPETIRPRADHGQDAPLSFAQERLWLMDQLAGSVAYNVPHAVRFRGDLRVAALGWALGVVVARHEVLRTCYPVVGGRVVQRVLPAGFGLGWRDVSGAADPEGALWERARQEACEPFDLAAGPVLRGELVRVAADDHVLLLTVHHIASDGWSSGVLVGEVLELYPRHDTAGGGAVLAPLAVQYADFAVWQRGWLRGEVLAGLVEYWRDRLAGASVLALPADRPRPAVLSGAGRVRRFTVPGPLRSALAGLAAGEGVTLFMVLVAAFKAVLSRLTGQADITIGTQIANRNRAELESLVGFFVNTLVLRTDLAGDPSFRELLGRVRDTLLGAYAHQDLPFEKLVHELRPARDLAQPLPLFNVDCMLQNAPYPRHGLPGLEAEILDRHTWTAKSDLGLMFWESGPPEDRSLIGWYEYSTELFDDGTIARFIDQLLRLMSAAVAAPDTRLSALPLLSPEEISTQLWRWNAPARYPAPADTVLCLFGDAVRRRGRQPAVIAAAETISFQDLEQRANQLAHRLAALGIGPEDRVAIVADRTVGTFVALLGVLKAGAAFLLLDTSEPARRTARIINGAAPAAFVGQPPDGSPGSVPVLAVPGSGETADAPPEVAIRGSQLAYIMYTSGSTGEPKGAMAEHQGLVNLARWLGATIYRNPGGRPRAGCFNADFASDAFIEDLCLLFLGETMHLADSVLRRDPPRFARFLRDAQVALFQCSPTQFAQLSEHGLLDGSGPLRTLIVAGEAVSRELWQTLGAQRQVEAWNVYGPTECSVDATAARIETGAPLSIGRPVHNASAHVIDGYGNLLPVGVPGEIVIGGVAVGRGYLGRPRETAAAFVPDPYAGRPGARMYRTGDIGAYLPDGSIAFRGRRDSQVKIRGHRVELAEIAAVLRELPEVTDAYADLADVGGEPRLVGYVVPAASRSARDGHAAELVGLWRQIFDVEQAGVPADPRLDTAGWVDTSSFRPISAGEMREYRDLTVARIRRLGSRRMIEIGCGTGLILFGLADTLDSYTGVDFSPVTCAKLESARKEAGLQLPVTLIEATADDLSAVGDGPFDTGVLNSVVQYFPHLDYLRAALGELTARLTADGVIFLGDLRGPEALELTHIWIEYSRQDPSVPVAELSRRVAAAVRRDREFLFSPALLDAAGALAPGLAWAEYSVHDGRGGNEMVRFRYDAVLHRRPPDATTAPRWLPWSPAVTVAAMRAAIAAHDRREPATALGWHTVSNLRLWPERALQQAMRSGQAGCARDVLRDASPAARGLDPLDLFALGEELGREIRVTWSPGRDDGAVDIAVLPASLAGQRVRVLPPDHPGPPPARPVSEPALVHARQALYPRLREQVAERLPAHMVPTAFVLLDRFPVNAAGKVDRRALPAADIDRPDADRHSELPAGPVQAQIADLWRRLLGLSAVAATGNFFVLGGHSLIATTMINEINNAFGVDLSIRDAFEHPVLRDLAAAVTDAADRGLAAAPLLPALRDEHMPLSFGQERLWLMDQLAGSVAYNVPHAVRFRGDLRVAALGWALGVVVARHEVLRTCYPVVGGRVVQRVLPAGFGLGWRDVSGAADPEGALWERARQEACEPFDLAAGPVLRGELVRVAADDHVLLLTVHHIASDGWSSGVLVGEVLELYPRHDTAGGGAVLAPLAVQYADFAVWQRGWLRGEVLAGLVEYWRDRLAGASVLALPADRPRPAVLSGAGRVRRFTVPGPLRSALAGLAAGEGVTLFMVLVAAFKAVLSRLTGQADITIGTAMSGRRRAALEPLVGFFVNTLVLRTDLAGDPSFRELLGRVRDTLLGAYAHQDLPFEKLVHELRPAAAGQAGFTPWPFFEIVFQLDDTAPDLPMLDDVGTEPLFIDKGVVKLPLIVTMSTLADGSLDGGVEYMPELIADDDVTRLIEVFRDCLQAVADDVGCPLGSLPGALAGPGGQAGPERAGR